MAAGRAPRLAGLRVTERCPFRVPRFPGAHRLPDWDHVAGEWAAALKTESLRGDPHISALIEELTVVAGAPFTDRLAAPALVPRGSRVVRWRPETGVLRLESETLAFSDADDDQRLTAYLPADEGATTGLASLVGQQPGGLSAVGARAPSPR